MHGFRRLCIKTAEVMMVVIVIFSVLSFAVTGGIAGYGAGGGALALVGLIAGGVGGLVLGAVTASFFFLMVEIAENTRPAAPLGGAIGQR